MPKFFKKVLVANRGEIAIRIIRALHEMEIEAVAVYSEADRISSHISLADEAYLLGGPIASDSYLNIPKIIDAAKSANPPIKLKFIISDTRQALGDIYAFARKNEGLFSFVSVAPLIRQLIESEISQKNPWTDSDLKELLIQPITKEEENDDE